MADEPQPFEREVTDIEQAVAEIHPTAEPTAESSEAARQKIATRTALTLLELGSHTLVLGLALLSIFLIHLILEGLLGAGAKFFNYIPISWIIDVADLLVIGKFLWEVIQDFKTGRR